MIERRDMLGRVAVVVDDEMSARIVESYAETHSMQRTADALGIGYGSVQRSLASLGVARRTYGGESAETKVCIHCEDEKPLSEFGENFRKIGKRTECLRCESITKVCRRYGISREQYEEMWRQQAGLCAICGSEGRERHARGRALLPLVVDHDHETGDVRGLLCGNCNSGIGMLGDDAETLETAAAYLRAARPE